MWREGRRDLERQPCLVTVVTLAFPPPARYPTEYRARYPTEYPRTSGIPVFVVAWLAMARTLAAVGGWFEPERHPGPHLWYGPGCRSLDRCGSARRRGDPDE